MKPKRDGTFLYHVGFFITLIGFLFMFEIDEIEDVRKELEKILK
jgi:hypothetical protein